MENHGEEVRWYLSSFAPPYVKVRDCWHYIIWNLFIPEGFLDFDSAVVLWFRVSIAVEMFIVPHTLPSDVRRYLGL